MASCLCQAYQVQYSEFRSTNSYVRGIVWQRPLLDIYCMQNTTRNMISPDLPEHTDEADGTIVLRQLNKRSTVRVKRYEFEIFVRMVFYDEISHLSSFNAVCRPIVHLKDSAMKQNEILSFYTYSIPNGRRAFMPVKSGWSRHFIYTDRHVKNQLGFGGNMLFVKLNDGRIVVTNDLWEDKEGWVSAVPAGSLIGMILKTHVCYPKSTESLVALFGMLVHPIKPTEGFDSRWTIKSGLSDFEAYQLSDQQPPRCYLDSFQDRRRTRNSLQRTGRFGRRRPRANTGVHLVCQR